LGLLLLAMQGSAPEPCTFVYAEAPHFPSGVMASNALFQVA
jgi:hypothetical protein